MLPRSLQKLLQETEYPPQKPDLMMSRTNKVVMIVETVSPTPFALLRRANHFQYRDSDKALQEFADFEDPIQALTEECRRVLKAVSAANQSQVSSSKHSTSLREASWSRFEDVGFTSALEDDEEDEDSALAKKQQPEGLRTAPSSGNGLGRPTTPSWADFLSSGFVDDNQTRSNLLLPPDKVLPPIDTQHRQRSSQSHRPRLESDRDLDPGELASITFLDLDDAFWWVWMSSLAPEETADRKAAFGRCAVVETRIRSGRWLVMEEMVAGAAPEPEEGAYIAEKKGFFSWTRRGKTLGRRKSTGKQALDRGDKNSGNNFGISKTSIGPDTHAKIQAKAAQLRAADDRQKQDAINSQRRGRNEPDSMDKTTSVMTLQPNLVGEASAAMKWAKKYDKGTIKEAYLANSNAGRGSALSPVPTEHTNGHADTNGSTKEPEQRPEVPAKAPEPEPKVEAVPQRKPVGASAPAAPTPEEQAVAPADKAQEAEPQAQDIPLPPPKDEPAAETPRESAASPEPTSAAPEEHKKPKKLTKDKSGGLRKLFSRKNKTPKAENTTSNLTTVMGRDSPTPEPAVQQTPIPEVTPEAAEPTAEPPQEATGKAPEAPEAPETQKNRASGGEPSPVDTKDAAEAKREFSRFDQGPLTDQPAFAPDDDDEGDATPPPIARRPPQRAGSSLKSTDEPKKEEKLSHTAGPGVQDRWAQIRKNAADRAAQYQRPEEPNRSSYHAPKPAGNDDDDTSGEESEWTLFTNLIVHHANILAAIESRVARIKARVAELTGTMEGANGAQGSPGTRSPNPASPAHQ